MGVVALFFVCDRLGYWGLAQLANRFYGHAEVGRDWYGATEFIRSGFYHAFISGTSRAKEAIMPLYLFNRLGLRALNTASPGRYPRFHYHHYLKLKEKNGPPLLYIYGMDYFTFIKESNEKQLQGLLGGEKGGQGWQIETMTNPTSPLGSRFSQLFRAKKEIDAFFVDLLDYLSFRYPLGERQGVAPGGISKYKGLYGTVPAENALRPSNWSKATYDPLPGVEGDYFLLLLEQLRRDKVMVILLVIPEFIAVYETNFDHQRQLADLEALTRRFHNLFVLDYNNPTRFELDNPALFADGRYGERISHLSVFGAERLGEMLAVDIPALQREWQVRRK